jgi:hypothetical protein
MKTHLVTAVLFITSFFSSFGQEDVEISEMMTLYGHAEEEVKYASNDAKRMKRYLVEVLGFSEGNVLFYENASKSKFELLFGTESNHKGKLFNTIQQGKSDVFIYYSGHGAPNMETGNGYFLPVDADPHYIDLQGYALETFYKNLSKLPANSKTVVMDACFSGANIFEDVSAVQVKVKEEYRQQKDMAILTSSKGSQFSSWYNAKEHGLFTWFFLKALHDYKTTDANNDRTITMQEVYQVVSDNNKGVPQYARRLHGVEQAPVLRGGEEEQVVLRY